MDRRECQIGNPGSGRGGRGGRWLALSGGVFGTLLMHSPKVPHPDFSVQVVRHNLKIFAVEKFEGNAAGLGESNGDYVARSPKKPHFWQRTREMGHPATAGERRRPQALKRGENGWFIGTTSVVTFPELYEPWIAAVNRCAPKGAILNVLRENVPGQDWANRLRHACAIGLCCGNRESQGSHDFGQSSEEGFASFVESQLRFFQEGAGAILPQALGILVR